MITSLLFVTVALVLSLVLVISVRRYRNLHPALAHLSAQLRTVDLDAFRNLVDPDEEDFLRRNLPPEEFRGVQRARLRAAVEYIRCASHNATVLLRLGESARHSPDARIAAAGGELVDTALRLRLYAFQAIAKLYLGMVFPGTHWSPLDVIDKYQEVRGLVSQLGRLQYPSSAARITAAL